MKSFWKGRHVLVTGHTGFKGSWLALWLNELGANVYGYALEPELKPSLFDQLLLPKSIHHQIGDIRDSEFFSKNVLDVNPDIIIHLAAQPHVRRSYHEPLYTWQTNVMGSLNVLEASAKLNKKCAVVIVTTDKVYDNKEWDYAYREIDRLGGYDPYSSSKAATELAVSSWRNSFFKKENLVRVATARAGNVIGGGDWSEDRIIPDLIRAAMSGNTLCVRNPNSVRPWQHVLEPLSGYLNLAERLYESASPSFQTAVNFGPHSNNYRTVEDLVNTSLKYCSGSWKNAAVPNDLHEARLLNLTIDRAYSLLDWKPKWNFEESVEKTIVWYTSNQNGTDMVSYTLEQIKMYSQA